MASQFPRYERWIELMLKAGLTLKERLELRALDKDLDDFKAMNPDFVPGAPFRATIGDILKARR